jgi:adenylate cyclase
MTTLASIRNSFLGIIPSTIVTASKSGIPNIAYLSQVHLLSETQIALTTQFFNKTKNNLLEKPLCTVRVYEPDLFIAYEIQAKYFKTETEGPVFDQMDRKLAAIADHSGHADLFKLRAIEILDVLNIEVVQCESLSSIEQPEIDPTQNSLINLDSLQKVCERISPVQSLEELFDTLLQAIDLEFGLRHSMFLVPQDNSNQLLTISTRGYEQLGVGSEVNFGEGIIGRAAQSKIPFVHDSLAREFLYVRSSTEATPPQDKIGLVSNPIPLPGLKNSQSQMAVPIALRGELFGVLFAESENIFEFRNLESNILKTLSHVLAMAVNILQLNHDTDEAKTLREIKPSPRVQKSGEKIIFNYYPKEDCILLNGEYLIKNVPARILWKILNLYKTEGKQEFTNRELRLDPWLQLPDFKDNLETRLILLRKRLEKKCSSVSLVSSGRGRFSILVSGNIVLTES